MEFFQFWWGLWHGIIAWIVLVVHAIGGWADLPVFDAARNGNWYVFGFLLGAGSPVLGMFGSRQGSRHARNRPPRAT